MKKQILLYSCRSEEFLLFHLESLSSIYQSLGCILSLVFHFLSLLMMNSFCLVTLCSIQKKTWCLKKPFSGVPMWCSRLRIQHFHCSQSGYSCHVGLIPGLGTSECYGCNQKKKTPCNKKPLSWWSTFPSRREIPWNLVSISDYHQGWKDRTTQTPLENLRTVPFSWPPALPHLPWGSSSRRDLRASDL